MDEIGGGKKREIEIGNRPVFLSSLCRRVPGKRTLCVSLPEAVDEECILALDFYMKILY